MLDRYWACAWMLALWDEYVWTTGDLQGGVCPMYVFCKHTAHPHGEEGIRNLRTLGILNPLLIMSAHDCGNKKRTRQLILEVAAS